MTDSQLTPDLSADIVIKLGGSLMFSKELTPWLDKIQLIHEQHNQKILIVPGGGKFADQVRELQSDQGFNDQIAHKLAIQAMGKYGQGLIDLMNKQEATNKLLQANSLKAIRSCFASNQIPICCPDADFVDVIDLPASWDVTSDSISGWFAKVLQAKSLWLIKSVTPSSSSYAIDDLIRDDVIDPYLPTVISNTPLDLYWFGPSAWRFDGLDKLGQIADCARISVDT